MKQTDFVGGFAKGLRVIEAFDAATPKLSIAHIAEATGLDRATARRCLLTLVDLGYARSDGKYFELTPRILRLGHAYLAATPFPRLIQPHLDALSEEVSESASASVLEGTEIVYVARASQKRVMSISLMPGSRLPAWCASMGRVLLAALPEKDLRPILDRSEMRALTPNTKDTLEKLITELALVREQGYAVNDQELEIGLRSIAVPVHNMHGRIVAALNIGVASSAVSVADMRARFLPALQKVQESLRGILT